LTNHFVINESETQGSLSLSELNNELQLIQSGEKRVCIIGTRNISITHQQIAEMISKALVEAGNTVITSGGSSGVNSAAIRGAMSANPDKLEVILPQTLSLQPPDVQELLKEARLVIEHEDRMDMDFREASQICYREIIDSSHQMVCFLYHDSDTLAKAMEYASMNRKIVTNFYLD
jgi:hypothetical protein